MQNKVVFFDYDLFIAMAGAASEAALAIYFNIYLSFTQ